MGVTSSSHQKQVAPPIQNSARQKCTSSSSTTLPESTFNDTSETSTGLWETVKALQIRKKPSSSQSVFIGEDCCSTGHRLVFLEQCGDMNCRCHTGCKDLGCRQCAATFDIDGKASERKIRQQANGGSIVTNNTKTGRRRVPGRPPLHPTHLRAQLQVTLSRPEKPPSSRNLQQCRQDDRAPLLPGRR